MAMNEIERVVDATIRRLRQEGLIRGDDDAEYRRGGDILRRVSRRRASCRQNRLWRR